MNWRKPIIYSVLYLSGSGIPRYLREIRRVAQLTDAEKQAYQDAKLKKLLLHASKHVPYYQSVLAEAGVVDGDTVDLSKFSNIPILTKDIIRREGERMYATEHTKRKSYENTSGGSTGEPVRFLQDKEYRDWSNATKLFYFNEQLGKEIGELEINLWGSDRDINNNTLGLKESVQNMLYNRVFLNAFKISNDSLKNYVRIINKLKPVSFWAYVESIDSLAQYIKKNHILVHSPKFIISTAGTLYPEIRNSVQSVFCCPVYNQYGSREVSVIAGETERGIGLEVFFWHNNLELGKDGSIVVTGLNNFSMPLIRYKVGDMATAAPQFSNNRSILFIKDVLGREISHFVGKDGVKIHGQYFIHLFYFRDWVKQFQIRQTDYNTIECYVVLRGKGKENEMREVEIAFNRALGQEFAIKWKFVDNIEPSKSGKYLYTICEI